MPRSRHRLPGTAVVAALLAAASVGAADPENRPESLPGYEIESARAAHGLSGSDEFEEDAIALPPFPSRSDLVEIDPGQVRQPYTVFVVPGSLTVGEDWVHRYVVVLESTSGARNVFFEGARCATGEARTYAYGLPGREEFRPLGGGWRPAAHHGAKAYQAFLLDGILCVADTRRPRRADEVRDVIAARAVGGAVNAVVEPPKYPR